MLDKLGEFPGSQCKMCIIIYGWLWTHNAEGISLFQQESGLALHSRRLRTSQSIQRALWSLVSFCVQITVRLAISTDLGHIKVCHLCQLQAAKSTPLLDKQTKGACTLPSPTTTRGTWLYSCVICCVWYSLQLKINEKLYSLTYI